MCVKSTQHSARYMRACVCTSHSFGPYSLHEASPTEQNLLHSLAITDNTVTLPLAQADVKKAALVDALTRKAVALCSFDCTNNKSHDAKGVQPEGGQREEQKEDPFVPVYLSLQQWAEPEKNTTLAKLYMQSEERAGRYAE